MKKPQLTFAVALLSAMLVISGCQVRLDTPDPQELVPDAAEATRSAAVSSALGLAESANYLLSLPDDVLAPVFAEISAQAAQHADALGGVYESGLPILETAEEAEDEVAEPGATPESLLADLNAASTSNFAAALSQESAEDFHLYAAIGIAQALDADRLNIALGEEIAENELPEFPTAVQVPESTRDALIVAEDQLGFLYQFLAARAGIAPQGSGDDAVANATALRITLLELSRAHAARGEQWATAANISNTVADPREATYALPTAEEEVTSAHAETLLANLVPIYSLHAYQTTPDQRAAALDLWLFVSLEAERTGSELGSFPGR